MAKKSGGRGRGEGSRGAEGIKKKEGGKILIGEGNLSTPKLSDSLHCLLVRCNSIAFLYDLTFRPRLSFISKSCKCISVNC
jgi:hypothetical protein